MTRCVAAKEEPSAHSPPLGRDRQRHAVAYVAKDQKAPERAQEHSRLAVLGLNDEPGERCVGEQGDLVAEQAQREPDHIVDRHLRWAACLGLYSKCSILPGAKRNPRCQTS